MRKAGDRTRRRRLNKLSCAGWLPHDRGSVSGLPHSRSEHRSWDRLIGAQEDSPPRPCLQPCASDLLVGLFLCLVQQLSQESLGCAMRAFAQMKPTISRAMVVVTTTFGLPEAARRRYLAHSRTCAFQAISRISADSGSRRWLIFRLTRADIRYVQAPSISTPGPAHCRPW
jgi:hypothetical protein